MIGICRNRGYACHNLFFLGGMILVRIAVDTKWKFRMITGKRAGEFAYAVVPGSVYTDLLREGMMEDPFFKDNEDKALRLMDNDFEYETEFDVSEEFLSSYDQILHFDGLDTIADVFLNGNKLGSTQNMHRMYEFDIKGIVSKENNKLTVLFHSPTKYIKEAFDNDYIDGTADAMPGFPHIRKIHSSFGWDWGAHLPDAGIYRPVYLIGADNVRIESVQILQKHEEDTTNVCISLNPELLIDCTSLTDEEDTLSKLSMKAVVTGPDGAVYEGRIENVIKKEDKINTENEINTECVSTLLASCSQETANVKEKRCGNCNSIAFDIADGLIGRRLKCKDLNYRINIDNAKLWWPNGYGDQPLYTVKVILYQGDQIVDTLIRKIGLRTIDLNLHQGNNSKDFAIRVNGVPIFAMGADYIPEDHLLGRVTPATTRSLLKKAVFANHNCIRVWGGGYYPEDWFYDICDELGLVVWQDMMFACAVYHLTREFEKNITEEFKQNLRRLRHHASLGLICGNNEMEQFVSTGTWVHKKEEVRDYTIMYERLIPSIVNELCPQISYWPSSPSSGGAFNEPSAYDRGDQHYWEVWHGDKPFTEYRKYKFRFLSEFGFQSFPLRKTIDLITDDEKDRNIFSYVMERHQRNGAANGKIMNYMQKTYRYPSSFDTTLYASHMLQADGIRLGIEHLRRYRGQCMGTVVWQLNDCWPVASWSSIDYAGRLKALHYAQKRAFAPLLLSCEENGRINSEKELNVIPKDFEKSIRLCVSNETLKSQNVTVVWELRNANGRCTSEIMETAAGTKNLTIPALSSVWLDKVDMAGVDEFTQYVSFHLLNEDGEEISSGSVIFSLPKYFHFEDPHLTAKVNGDIITVTSKAYAKGVEILNDNEDLILSDNYFDMDQGQKSVKVLSGSTEHLYLRSVYDI